MKYFKNTELAKIYKVSEKSVRNWIDSTKQGKLDFELYEASKKFYIANTSRNTLLIEKLVEKGKKFINTRGYKLVSPSKNFYKLYSTTQILDIISNIDNYGELPLQYCYFDGGAKQWDKYVAHLAGEESTNPLSNTHELLNLSLPYIESLISRFSRINIIDVGVGNAMPIRPVLEHFISKDKLNRYIALDISSEMLAIANKNITKWFGENINYEGYVRDFNYDRFDDLLVADQFSQGENIANLIFFLGGTLNNLREPDHALATVHNSMGKNDLLLLTKKLDTIRSRLHFDVAGPGGMAITLVADLLNIDSPYYELEQTFDSRRMAREVKLHFKVAVAIEFKIDNQSRKVEINKGESLLLWRAKHQNALETIQHLDENGFILLEAMRSKDQDYFLTISKIKTDR